MREDIARGCLKTGEPVEALWGAGWWSEDRQEPDCPPIVRCGECGGNAYDLGDAVDCENCGVVEEGGSE